MPFKGTIKSQIQYTLDVNPASTNAGPTAVTVASIVRRDLFREANDFTFTVGGGAANVQSETLGGNVTRALIFVNNPPGGSCRFKLSQNNQTLIEEVVDGDLTYALTVTP